jgi:hypothetical protein
MHAAGRDPDGNVPARSDLLISYSGSPKLGITVIMGRHLDARSSLQPMPDSTRRTLVSLGIKMLLLGHTPHGTCPSLLREEDGMTVVMADTSYSDMSQPDCRGAAFSTVTLTPAVTITHRIFSFEKNECSNPRIDVMLHCACLEMEMNQRKLADPFFFFFLPFLYVCLFVFCLYICSC